MNTLRMTLLGLALASVAAPALAQTAPPHGPRGGRGAAAMFDRIDADKDGRVVWEEVWVFVQARFNAADGDHDGRLTQQEMEAARPWPGQRPGGAAPEQRGRMVGMMFRAMDANRDGFVVLEEVRPLAEARFRALDANGDGAVTRDELPAPPRRQRQRG